MYLYIAPKTTETVSEEGWEFLQWYTNEFRRTFLVPLFLLLQDLLAHGNQMPTNESSSLHVLGELHANPSIRN